MSLVHGQAHGFLDHHVLARAERLDRQRAVGEVRGDDGHQVQLAPVVHFGGRVPGLDAGPVLLGGGGAVWVAVADGHEFEFGGMVNPRRVRPPEVVHGSVADHRATYLLAHAGSPDLIFPDLIIALIMVRISRPVIASRLCPVAPARR